jgi:hypothetical protein
MGEKNLVIPSVTKKSDTPHKKNCKRNRTIPVTSCIMLPSKIVYFSNYIIGLHVFIISK